jgi:hypothetical protein
MIKTILIALAILLTLGFIAYRFVAPKALVEIGKKGMSQNKLKIIRTFKSNETQDDNNNTIKSIQGNCFINIECSINLPFSQVDIYDFQLVKNKKNKVGTEENVGDNLSDNYFYWDQITQKNNENCYIRLTFQIPDSAAEGYLFYWGKYWGPINLK